MIFILYDLSLLGSHPHVVASGILPDGLQNSDSRESPGTDSSPEVLSRYFLTVELILMLPPSTFEYCPASALPL